MDADPREESSDFYLTGFILAAGSGATVVAVIWLLWSHFAVTCM